MIDMTDATIEKWRFKAGPQAVRSLLAWFDREKRDLPWRQSKEPYRIWLSEIMLQQTQVATVIPYFAAFLARWPTMRDLAQAEDEQVLKAWEGLGYYSRARNLLAAARICCSRHGCQVPAVEKERLSLPGIGEYTAAAIGAIAFGQPAAAVDGNIVRVFARLTATAWNPADLAQRRVVRRLAESILPADRPGDYNEALMDLGATVCLPRQPRCEVCPLKTYCRAFATGSTGDYPGKPPKKDRPTEAWTVLALVWSGKVHVRQRPDQGLLAGLYEFDWLESASEDALSRAGLTAASAHIVPLGRQTHDFTHKRWIMDGFLIDCRQDPQRVEGRWVDAAELAALPFPTALAAFRQKVLELLKI